MTDASKPVRRQLISRRDFVKTAGVAGATMLVGLSLSGCEAADRAILHKQTVTDDMGREMEIPTIEEIHSIFFTSGLAQVYIEALRPDLLGGSAAKYTEEELPFHVEGIENLPYLGTLHNNDEIDREALLVEDIDIMFSISGVGLTQANRSEAEEIQQQTGIPVLLVDGSFERIPHVFRFLGELLDCKDRAEELAQYAERIYTEVSDVVAQIPVDERIWMYYAEGPEGLQTEPETSQHMSGFLAAGALDVATCEETYGGGMTDVSLEQVLKWDPPVIIAWSAEIRGGAVEDIRSNPLWADIQAVKNGNVFAMPNLPWAWCDRPPGVNRLMGIQWICNLFYPDRYPIDIVERAQEFFKVMLKVDVERQTIVDMLGNSYPVPDSMRALSAAASQGVGYSVASEDAAQDAVERETDGREIEGTPDDEREAGA